MYKNIPGYLTVSGDLFHLSKQRNRPAVLASTLFYFTGKRSLPAYVV